MSLFLSTFIQSLLYSRSEQHVRRVTSVIRFAEENIKYTMYGRVLTRGETDNHLLHLQGLLNSNNRIMNRSMNILSLPKARHVVTNYLSTVVGRVKLCLRGNLSIAQRTSVDCKRIIT